MLDGIYSPVFAFTYTRVQDVRLLRVNSIFLHFLILFAKFNEKERTQVL